jgi:hypothetical protein
MVSYNFYSRKLRKAITDARAAYDLHSGRPYKSQRVDAWAILNKTVKSRYLTNCIEEYRRTYNTLPVPQPICVAPYPRGHRQAYYDAMNAWMDADNDRQAYNDAAYNSMDAHVYWLIHVKTGCDY